MSKGQLRRGRWRYRWPASNTYFDFLLRLSFVRRWARFMRNDVGPSPLAHRGGTGLLNRGSAEERPCGAAAGYLAEEGRRVSGPGGPRNVHLVPSPTPPTDRRAPPGLTRKDHTTCFITESAQV